MVWYRSHRRDADPTDDPPALSAVGRPAEPPGQSRFASRPRVPTDTRTPTGAGRPDRPPYRPHRIPVPYG